jgi:hypothetical protein
MKKVLFGLALCSLIVGNSQAADRLSKPSEETLAKMGLSGMVVVSDAEGTAIRGKGFKNPAGNFVGYKPGGGFKNPAGNFKGYKPGAGPK